jgi:hypothetical protein
MVSTMTSTHQIQITLRPSCSFAANQALYRTPPSTLRSKMLIRSATEGSSDSPNSTNSESTNPSSPPPPPPRIVTSRPTGRSYTPPPPSAMQPDLKFQKVETLDTDSIAGVASVERTSKSGDVSHHEALTLATSFETALPFLVGWFATAPFLGGFGKEAQGGNVGSAVGAAAKSWIVAVPISIVIRSLLRGYVPDKAFIIVSFVATAVLLFGLRAAQAAVTPEGSSSSSGNARRNKKGNPLEFFSLLASLTKRW